LYTNNLRQRQSSADFALSINDRIGGQVHPVARSLRRPQSFVSKCESGERRVDVVELQDFARLYGKPLDFFV
jgi:hypothetical protein